MTETVYERLVSGSTAGCSGEPFDRHVFACAIAVCGGDPAQFQGLALTQALGLSPDALLALFVRYFPHALDLLPEEGSDPRATDSVEEPDLRALLAAHRARELADEEEWLAAIIARRSLCENHLWQDLGLRSRDDLNALMARHFPGLKALNAGNMKWKKFFYRTLCQTDGAVVCLSPTCEACDDHAFCFGEESGEPILFRISQPIEPYGAATA